MGGFRMEPPVALAATPYSPSEACFYEDFAGKWKLAFLGEPTVAMLLSDVTLTHGEKLAPAIIYSVTESR